MLRVWVEAGATSYVVRWRVPKTVVVMTSAAAAHPEASGFDSGRFGGQTVLVPENLGNSCNGRTAICLSRRIQKDHAQYKKIR